MLSTLIKACFLLCFCCRVACASEVNPTYAQVVESLIYFKNDRFNFFYGGPVDRPSSHLKWVSVAAFKDEFNKTRAVYEISFINCDLENAAGAEVLFIKASDVNIKFKNTLSKDYEAFSALLDGKYSSGKYIVVRSSDAANVYYPEVCIRSDLSDADEKADRMVIAQFFSTILRTKPGFVEYYKGGEQCELDFENDSIISYKPVRLSVNLEIGERSFYLTRKVLKNDPWKLYYIISKTKKIASTRNPLLIRLDSGCVSGQIYDDQACDCLDQLHAGLNQIAAETDEEGMILHIPAHDGRGFGTAPKAETEIYKRGGKGRVHSSKPLDTISAAKLLYNDLDYDIRTYDGAAKILRSMNIEKVILLTDNRVKVEALEKCGIEVIRKKTETAKKSCIQHINSKKESENYFKS